MKISSTSIPGKPKRYTSNIRRGKERKARSGSHSSGEELTESLLRGYDEEEGRGAGEGEGEEEVEEVVLNEHHGSFKVTEYPDILKKKEKVKRGEPKIVDVEDPHSNRISHSETKQKQRKSDHVAPPVVSLPHANYDSHHREPSHDTMTEAEEENIHFPIASFEVEDPEQLPKKSSRDSKKKSYLSGKPLIGLYDRSRGQEDKKEPKHDTLATRWLQAQQPKHNDLFDQQDAIEHYNVDGQDHSHAHKKKNQDQTPDREGEGEPLTLLDKHFSHSTAVRHFNESMPVSSSS
jgi:hypothetical protein